MRIDIHAINFTASDELRDYARARVWQAAGPSARRVAWVGLWMVDHGDTTERADVSCRLDAWVRRHGVVTVRHSEVDAYRAIDTAAARLERELSRKLKRQTRLAASGRERREAQPPHVGSPPRLAALIERADLRGQRRLLSFLRNHYGVEQVSRIGLSATLWSAAAGGAGLAEELRDRLALSLLGQPELIIVAGHAGESDGGAAVRAEQEQVRRIVSRLRAWEMPVDVIGLWVEHDPGGQWKLRCRELMRSMPDAATDPDVYSDLEPSREMPVTHNARAMDVFLDFDPVCPYWPGDGALRPLARELFQDKGNAGAPLSRH